MCDISSYVMEDNKIKLDDLLEFLELKSKENNIMAIEIEDLSIICDGDDYNPTIVMRKDFENVSFKKCYFKNIEFQHCNFNIINFERCTFKKVKFLHSIIENSFFISNVPLYGNTMKLVLSSIKNTDFYGSTAIGLYNCDLDKVKIVNCLKWNFLDSCIKDTDLITNYEFGFSESSITTSFFRNMTDTHFFGGKVCYCNFDNLNEVKITDTFFNLDSSETNNNIIENAKDVILKNTNLLSVCPEEGSFIGYKKVFVNGIVKGVAKLLIGETSKRSSGYSRKCRCDKAIVLSIERKVVNEKGEVTYEHFNEARSIHDPGFEYIVGAEVEADDFDEDRWTECSNGIHFFMTRQEAEAY